MVVQGDRRACRRSLYNGLAAPRLTAALTGARRRLAVAAAFAVLVCGGCSYQLESITAKPDAGVEQTGSIVRPGAGRAAQATATAAAEPSPADLAYARAAAADALARGAKGNSVPWHNPQSGVGGNITPLASSYSAGGLSCRDFLASYVRGGAQAWLQGSACRSARGEWEIKSLKPLKSG